MIKEKTDIDWDLVAKHLVGETDCTEATLLAEWINCNESNRRYFSDLERWWKQVGQLTLYNKIDVAADWQKVKKQLQSYKPEYRITPPRRTFFNRYFLSKVAAAVIAMLLITGAIYYGLQNRKITPRETVFHQMIVPSGQRSQMVLADGTSVWLNSGSRLTFPMDFDSDYRLVKLEGEAYFEVTADKEKPFIVQTLGLEVKVYGTSFNVMSYSNDPFDEVTLLNGLVSVSGIGSKQEIVLQPGHKISCLRSEQRFSAPVTVVEEAAIAWREGKLVFDDLPFGEIAKKLERQYGVTIHITDKKIEQVHYRGVFRKETLEQAIKAIQLTSKFKYKIEENIVTIY